MILLPRKEKMVQNNIINKDDILVSIICLAYNHGKYISQTIKGFLEQKTDFRFEIIIHDDCSTDNTREIIEAYRRNNPEIIHAIYQDENQYSKKIPIMRNFIYPIVNGKYIAYCEGDDYWCDSTKLQKQVNVFRKQPQTVMVCHNTRRITEDGNEIDIMVKKKETGQCFPSEFIKKSSGLCPHLSSFMLKVEIATAQMPRFFSLVTGDNATRLFCLTKGDVYYLNDVMSVYRMGVPGSWTSRFKADRNMRITGNEKKIEFWRQYDQYTEGRYSKEIDKEIDLCKFNLGIYRGDYKEAYLYAKDLDIKFMFRIKIYILAKIPFVAHIVNRFLRK